MPGAGLFRTILQRRLLVFGLWWLTLIVAAIALPSHVRQTQSLSITEKSLLLLVALSSLLLSASLVDYFVEGWQRVREVANKRAYTVWLSFETLVGVPFLGVCVLFAFLSLWVLFSAPANAQTHKATPTFKVGMALRSFSPKEPYNWRGAQTHALRTTIWYPAAESATEQPLNIPGLSTIFVLGKVARDAAIADAPAKFPLILISHGTGGSGISMAWLGEALAAHGYIVAAVNHPGNNGAEPYTAQGFSIWWERATDLSSVIDAMLADSTFRSHIDPKRIAAAGFSLGGYTMIEIAGGITEPAEFEKFCASPRADGLCHSPPEFPTLIEDFNKLSKTDTEFQAALRHASDSRRDPRIRAVFAMAPALGPVFTRASLSKISIPVEIVAGAADANVPVESSAKYFAANIPRAKLTLFPGKVAHYVFLDSCPETGRQAQPVLCTDAPTVDRDAIHARTAAMAVDFFRRYLQ